MTYEGCASSSHTTLSTGPRNRLTDLAVNAAVTLHARELPVRQTVVIRFPGADTRTFCLRLPNKLGENHENTSVERNPVGKTLSAHKRSSMTCVTADEHGSIRARQAVIIGLVILLLLFATSLVFNNPFVIETAKAQDFDNARVADCALAELGTIRPIGWDQPGECIKSAQRWVTEAGGYFGPGGVISGYTNSGAIQVSASQATKGDIVQWTNGNDNDWSHPHTVCIVQNYGNGRYWIVQSNWDAPGLVSQNLNWDPNPEDYGRLGYYPMFWRFGNVVSPTPPITGGHDVVGATSPATTFYFAEGTCRPGFDPYFCIQNPGSTAGQRHPHLHEG